MANAAITFVSVLLAAALAYSAALTAWRRQQRREVYGAYIAAVDDILASLDQLLKCEDDSDADRAEPLQGRLSDRDEWRDSRRRRLKFDAAWCQVRLVAPSGLAEHAGRTGYALMDFEHQARDVRLDAAAELRKGEAFLQWDQAKAFVGKARKDLRVESRILMSLRRQQRD